MVYSRSGCRKSGATNGRHAQPVARNRRPVSARVFGPIPRNLTFALRSLMSPIHPGHRRQPGSVHARHISTSIENGKYIASIAAATKFTQQDVTLYNDPELSGEAEIAVLFPFYYRNAEVIVHGIGIDPTSKLLRATPDTRRRVLFHGDSSPTGTA